MRALLLAVLGALVLVCVPAAGAESYEALLARLKGGDTSIDFQALRYAYAETPAYNPYGNGGAAFDAVKALNNSDFDSALAEAEKVLASNYLSIEAHFVAFIVHNRRGNTVKADFHKLVMRGLRESITRSGDGNSPETAYVVISVDEEYAYLRTARLQVKSQTLLQTSKGPVDAMTVADENSKTEIIHFNVSKPMEALVRRLSGQRQK